MAAISFEPQRLAEHRRARGLSQRKLAEMAGISQALIAELERGKHPPSAPSLEKIARALGLSSSDFA